jgi:hypothetical protein
MLSAFIFYETESRRFAYTYVLCYYEYSKLNIHKQKEKSVEKTPEETKLSFISRFTAMSSVTLDIAFKFLKSPQKEAEFKKIIDLGEATLNRLENIFAEGSLKEEVFVASQIGFLKRFLDPLIKEMKEDKDNLLLQVISASKIIAFDQAVKAVYPEFALEPV